MTRATLHTATGPPLSERLNPVAAPDGPHDARDPWLRPGSPGFRASPQPGQPGHGGTAVLRSQPVLVVDGRVEGGAFELICGECGDNPRLDYSQVSPRLQQIRGPYTIAEGLAAYEQHLGLTTCDCPG